MSGQSEQARQVVLLQVRRLSQASRRHPRPHLRVALHVQGLEELNAIVHVHDIEYWDTDGARDASGQGWDNKEHVLKCTTLANRCSGFGAAQAAAAARRHSESGLVCNAGRTATIQLL